eukprot:GHVS01087628.1.p1 GENE.GHVS01087628.1~~GHVS01087628.1.p1  ORF type:complete len:125 (-),score=16.27 GHVS01087628.1:107-481(-)
MGFPLLPPHPTDSPPPVTWENIARPPAVRQLLTSLLGVRQLLTSMLQEQEQDNGGGGLEAPVVTRRCRLNNLEHNELTSEDYRCELGLYGHGYACKRPDHFWQVVCVEQFEDLEGGDYLTRRKP